MFGVEHRTQVKRVLGLDIGGANLQIAHTDGTAKTVPFESWKKPKKLSGSIASLLDLPAGIRTDSGHDTGELCDCFETRRDGVNTILDAIEEACTSFQIKIWLTTRSL